MMTITDEVFEKYVSLIEFSKTVGHIDTKEVLWLNDESPQNLGNCKIFSRWAPLIKFKGYLYLTKYRIVFSEKSLLLYPAMISFWFKPNFKDKTFHIRQGIAKKKEIECNKLIVDVELMRFPKKIELTVNRVKVDNTLAKRTSLSPFEYYLNKPKLFETIKNARDSASEITIDSLIDYLKKPELNPNKFRYGHEV